MSEPSHLRRFRRHALIMNPLDALAEKRIGEAQASGVFNDLPGAGAPLVLDDDTMVPEELRAAYRILKNSGFVPAEVEALRELREVEQALAQEQDEAQRSKLLGKLGILLTRAGALRSNRATDDHYYQKIAEKFAKRERQRTS